MNLFRRSTRSQTEENGVECAVDGTPETATTSPRSDKEDQGHGELWKSKSDYCKQTTMQAFNRMKENMGIPYASMG